MAAKLIQWMKENEQEQEYEEFNEQEYENADMVDASASE